MQFLTKAKDKYNYFIKKNLRKKETKVNDIN